MQFGVVLQNDPPAWRVVDLAVRAENYGFTSVWTFDSHLLWQEPFVVYSQILSATHRVTVGPMVTNPATRDWTVTASLFATLNDMFGNRTVCGIGRGDSAVRVINGKPVTEVITDKAWLEGEFISTVQQRGAAIIKARGLSSAASAANAVVDTVRSLVTPTPAGDWHSVAVCSPGDYGCEAGLMTSFPIRTVSDGKWEIVQGVPISDFSRGKIDATLNELKEERSLVSDLLPK